MGILSNLLTKPITWIVIIVLVVGGVVGYFFLTPTQAIVCTSDGCIESKIEIGFKDGTRDVYPKPIFIFDPSSGKALDTITQTLFFKPTSPDFTQVQVLRGTEAKVSVEGTDVTLTKTKYTTSTTTVTSVAVGTNIEIAKLEIIVDNLEVFLNTTVSEQFGNYKLIFEGKVVFKGTQPIDPSAQTVVVSAPVLEMPILWQPGALGGDAGWGPPVQTSHSVTLNFAPTDLGGTFRVTNSAGVVLYDASYTVSSASVSLEDGTYTVTVSGSQDAGASCVFIYKGSTSFTISGADMTVNVPMTKLTEQPIC